MAESVKGIAIGNVVLYEEPMHYSRSDHEVTRDLTATVGLEAGQAMDFTAGAAAAVQTVTMATASASGSFRIGYKGIWTTILAWDDVFGTINTALDVMVALSGGTAGDIVYAGATFITTGTFTFLNTLGNPETIVTDTRLLLTAAAAEAVATIATTTAGELTTMKEWATTTANADSLLIEPVSLADLNGANGQSLRRSFLTRGASVVNADAVTCPAGTRAALVTALLAVGIVSQREPVNTTTGTPRA